MQSRSEKLIRGIQVKGKELKLTHSLGKLLELLDLFQQCSGLKINSTKSEAIWLGKYRNNCSKLHDLKWPQDTIVALGTAFSHGAYKCEIKNFHEKATKMQPMFNLWSQRDLSLYGKITIAKTLGLSKMIFSSACLPTPSHIISSIDKWLQHLFGTISQPKSKEKA